MTVLSPASWSQYGSYDARNDRLHISSMLNTEGATSSTAFAVTQQIVASMVLTVGSGSAYINSGWASVQGFYCFVNDAPITVTVQPADPTYPRIDRVIARVYDAYYEGTENKAQIEIKKGDPAVSPQVPPLPSGSIELARISVAANATTIVTANINNSVMPLASFRDSLIQKSLATAWTPYTPVLSVDGTGTVVNPTNYTGTGRYKQIGSVVTTGFQIVAGAAFTPGSATGATYRISLPVPAALFMTPTVGHARMFDSSTGNAHLDIRLAVSGSSLLSMQYTTAHGGTLGNVSPSTPWVMAANDIVDGYLTYESAI